MASQQSAGTVATAGSMASRLTRGVAGGIVAGAVFIVVTIWFAATTGPNPQGPLLMISTIPTAAATPAEGVLGVGWVTHFVLSAVFGIIFALVVPRLPTNGALALGGTLYGALLYVVNFQLIARLAFPLFMMANQPFELMTHVVFGTLLAFAFYNSGPRREPLMT